VMWRLFSRVLNSAQDRAASAAEAAAEAKGAH